MEGRGGGRRRGLGVEGVVKGVVKGGFSAVDFDSWREEQWGSLG